MEIAKKREGTLLTITLEGELNTVTAPQLEAAIAEDLKTVNDVVFDMTDLFYITSAGLRLLLAAQQETAGRGNVVVRGACEEIREIIAITGFDSILTPE
ncbi:MAG: STAS domain-containing protein [Coriobacteriia bacterium]|nr:STAS domain-containing protein [Coriobacteriia bacterium]